MTRRFLRGVRVTVGDGGEAVRVENLLVRFRIKREATPTPAEGEIDIYNLNESNETRVRERGKRVVLEAGYMDRLDTVFDGEVRRVERQRVDLDRITRIHIAGALAKQVQTVSNLSYARPVTVRDIVRRGVADLGLALGPLDLIPEEADYPKFTYWGQTKRMITQRLRPLGIEWYEQDGVVHFTRNKVTLADRDVVISERTGMVGTPTTTDDGIRVVTLLDPRLKLGTRVRVLSSVLDDAASGDAINERARENEGGLWKVIEFEHRGSNREDEFFTTIEARPLAA